MNTTEMLRETARVAREEAETEPGVQRRQSLRRLALLLDATANQFDRTVWEYVSEGAVSEPSLILESHD